MWWSRKSLRISVVAPPTLPVLVAGLLAVGVVLAGCSPDGPATTSSLDRASDNTAVSGEMESAGTTTVAHQPVTSRWPPGVDAVVLAAARGGLWVVDADGVRWGREVPAPKTSTTVTVRGRPVIFGLDGLVVSKNGKFLAYAGSFLAEGDSEKEVVVRSIRDGTVVKRLAIDCKGHTTLWSLSNDGNLLALVTVDPELEAEKMAEEVPWTVSVVDLASGAVVAEETLAAFVRQRIEDPANGACGLVVLDWLPGDRLLVGVSGRPYETYVYDPATDSMKAIADLQYAWAVGADGLVLGQNLDTGSTVVWKDGAFEPLVLDAAWPRAGSGAISADGNALALWVSKTGGGRLTDEHGWQVFRRVGSEWRPAGPVAQVDWMNQPPAVVAGHGGMAWTVVYQSTAENATVLLSHDFATGEWQEWFRPEDMQLDLGSFYFAGIVLE